MSHRLKLRQKKIQAKRKNTPWRDFVMEIGSHFPVNLYHTQWMISKYPHTDRIGRLIVAKDRDNYPTVSSPYTWKFFDDMASLMKQSHLDNINFYGSNENCDYAEAVYGAKNGYLSFSFGDNAENIFYSCFVWTNVSNVVNSFYIEKDSDNVYHSYFVQSSSNIFYSKYITWCHEVWLSTNLTWCSECILCDDLENQSYCIHNQQYSKDVYLEKKQEILSKKIAFDELYSNLRPAKNKNTKNCIGTCIYQCENIENGNLVRNMTDSRNIICWTWWYTGSSNIYDWLDVWLDTHHMYGTGMAGTNSEHLYCCSWVTRCSYLFYSYHMESCSYCLGCIGLKNKSYCIFNKQYTKEERYDKIDEIFTQMEEDGTLGQFFPWWMNPFYFNDTAAYLIDDSFTKEEVTAKWYLRRDEPIQIDIPTWAKVVKTSELDQYEGWMVDGDFIPLSSGKQSTEWATWTIDPEILKVIIQDEEWNVYRIIPMEYKFLKKYGLPLPRKHRLERMKENFKIS